jgi:hypothetical protein
MDIVGNYLGAVQGGLMLACESGMERDELIQLACKLLATTERTIGHYREHVLADMPEVSNKLEAFDVTDRFAPPIERDLSDPVQREIGGDGLRSPIGHEEMAQACIEALAEGEIDAQTVDEVLDALVDEELGDLVVLVRHAAAHAGIVVADRHLPVIPLPTQPPTRSEADLKTT